jgi:hypothetical protein
MDATAVKLLKSIAKSHRVLVEHAVQLRSRSEVSSVAQHFDLTEVGECMRFEDFVDAFTELDVGHAISWCLEITIRQDTCVIEADVRRCEREGQSLITTIADEITLDQESCANTLPEIARRLCEVIPF